jgi:DNA-binding response OmpR family regulator
MPAMSGTELQTLLRKQGRSFPFIFITAFPKETVRIRVLSDGAIGFLVKPFDGLTLIRCVEAALRAHQDRPAGEQPLKNCRRRSGACPSEPMYRLAPTTRRLTRPPPYDRLTRRARTMLMFKG